MNQSSKKASDREYHNCLSRLRYNLRTVQSLLVIGRRKETRPLFDDIARCIDRMLKIAVAFPAENERRLSAVWNGDHSTKVPSLAQFLKDLPSGESDNYMELSNAGISARPYEECGERLESYVRLFQWEALKSRITESHYTTLRNIRKTASLSLAVALVALVAKYFADYDNGFTSQYFTLAHPGSRELVDTDRVMELEFDSVRDFPASVKRENFTARYEARLHVPRNANYTFYLSSDDGSRLFLNDKLIVDNWRVQSETEGSATVELLKGSVDIKVEYFQAQNDAVLKLHWESAEMPKSIISRNYLERLNSLAPRPRAASG